MVQTPQMKHDLKSSNHHSFHYPHTLSSAERYHQKTYSDSITLDSGSTASKMQQKTVSYAPNSDPSWLAWKNATSQPIYACGELEGCSLAT